MLPPQYPISNAVLGCEARPGTGLRPPRFIGSEPPPWEAASEEARTASSSSEKCNCRLGQNENLDSGISGGTGGVANIRARSIRLGRERIGPLGKSDSAFRSGTERIRAASYESPSMLDRILACISGLKAHERVMASLGPWLSMPDCGSGDLSAVRGERSGVHLCARDRRLFWRSVLRPLRCWSSAGSMMSTNLQRRLYVVLVSATNSQKHYLIGGANAGADR